MEEKKKGFPTWAIVVLVGLGIVVVGCPMIGIVAAIAIPSLLRSRVAANEMMAVGTLRSLVTTEAMWRQTDGDGNGLSDYWTADVSGLYRIERSPAGTGVPIAAIDVSIASADDDKFAAGAATPGKAGQGGTGASLLLFGATQARSGFFYRAMKTDSEGKAYAADGDGDGNAWTNVGEFAFQARPAQYDSMGVNTFIVNEAGVIYGRDFDNAAPENAEAWPAPSPSSKGWRVVR